MTLDLTRVRRGVGWCWGLGCLLASPLLDRGGVILVMMRVCVVVMGVWALSVLWQTRGSVREELACLVTGMAAIVVVGLLVLVAVMTLGILHLG